MDQLLCFYFCLLCYTAVLLNLTVSYCAQHYAQKKELWADYYALNIQFASKVQYSYVA